jgi:hypothetical protein
MIEDNISGVEFITGEHGRPGLALQQGPDEAAARGQSHQGPRSWLQSRSRARRGAGGRGANPGPAERLGHGVHHRRHGWRDWHRSRARHREDSLASSER